MVDLLSGSLRQDVGSIELENQSPPLIPARPPKPATISDSCRPPPVPPRQLNPKPAAAHEHSHPVVLPKTQNISAVNCNDLVGKAFLQAPPQAPMKMQLLKQANLKTTFSMPQPAPMLPVDNWQDNISLEPECMHQVYDFIPASSKKQLCEIVRDRDILPTRVAFCESLYGVCESFSFYNNELFDIHFMKESVVANVVTTHGTTVKIPLHPNFQFMLDCSAISLFYDDKDYSISQIMKLSRLPKVVVVKKGCKQSKKSTGFTEGEVLILGNHKKSKSIECISVLSKTKKTIGKSSSLLLTTANTSQIRFSFVDLIYFDCPLQVKIISPVRIQQRFAHESTITSLIKEKSLIASFSDIENKPRTNINLYEIFVDVPIDFQLAKYTDQMKEELVKKSTTIYETFTQASICKVILNTKNKLQREVYEMCTSCSARSDELKNVTELLPPKCFKTKQTANPVCQPIKNDIEEAEYDQIIYPNQKSVHLKSVHPNISYVSVSAKRQSSFEVPHDDTIRQRPIRSATFTASDTIQVERSIKLEDPIRSATFLASDTIQVERSIKLEDLSSGQV